ncbi:MAG: hypothetical protein ACJ79R_04055 [Anaeromyxobacteraceae bacterium]
MSCPYLTEITMSFCRAYPVKKLVPTERLGGASRCEGEAFFCCPVYRDTAARPAAAPASETPFHAATTGGKS